MPFFVYILRSSSNQLYIGQTNNLTKREHQHLTRSTESAKFIKDGSRFTLVYQEAYPTRIAAMHRETQLKGWSRDKKEALIAGNLSKLKDISKRKTI